MTDAGPVFTKQDDGTLTVEGCDPDSTYPATGAVLLHMVDRHNELVAEVQWLQKQLQDCQIDRSLDQENFRAWQRGER